MILRFRSPSRPGDSSLDVTTYGDTAVIRRGPHEPRAGYVGANMMPTPSAGPLPLTNSAETRRKARAAVCGFVMPRTGQMCFRKSHAGDNHRSEEYMNAEAARSKKARVERPTMVQPRCQWCQMFPCTCPLSVR